MLWRIWAPQAPGVSRGSDRFLNTIAEASRKPLFPRGPALGLKFLLFAALSIALMVADTHGERLQPLRQWASWALQPVLWAADLPREVAELAQHFRSRESLIAENEKLKRQQLELQGRLLRMESLEAENERIRALLASATTLDRRVLIAEILAIDQDPYRHQIVLNKGSRDGVYKGQALVDAGGILGQVIQVNPSTSVALLITDPDHGIPVEVNRTGLQTVALGRGDGQALSLPYLPGNADVKVGDLLVSSGLGGRFPAGYPVATVHELRHPAGESFMEAIAYPTARLDQGRQALLVWNERPPPAAELAPQPPPVAQAKAKAKPRSPARAKETSREPRR